MANVAALVALVKSQHVHGDVVDHDEPGPSVRERRRTSHRRAPCTVAIVVPGTESTWARGGY